MSIFQRAQSIVIICVYYVYGKWVHCTVHMGEATHEMLELSETHAECEPRKKRVRYGGVCIRVLCLANYQPRMCDARVFILHKNYVHNLEMGFHVLENANAYYSRFTHTI